MSIVSGLEDWIGDRFAAAQDMLFQQVVQPLSYALGLAYHLEDAYSATGTLLMGMIGVAVVAFVLAPLERLRPAEAYGERRAVTSDVIYTLIHRLGLFGLFAFVVVTPVENALDRVLAAFDLPPTTLLDAVPWIRDTPYASMAVYVVAVDFVLYWVHRGQHAFRFWWALHALHHSQRRMTVWTDDRNHLLDDLLIAFIMVLVGTLIGLPPGEFAWMVVVISLVESLSHANLRLDFGPIGERLLVSPRFHRMHHAIGDADAAEQRSSNYAVLFPVWDILFGTADFRRNAYFPTGIVGDDFGDGVIGQQVTGLRRLVQALRR